MNVFRTMIVPAALGPKAITITDALGYPEKGMFMTKVAEGEAPTDGKPDSRLVVAYISSGILDSDSPILADAPTLFAACNGAKGITLADCTEFVALRDVTQEAGLSRKALIEENIKAVTKATWKVDIAAAGLKREKEPIKAEAKG